ncbi:DUF4179 domain-containing protein [Desulfosporosinus sp. BG]|uniref:DUF4179 domain-containing protein n=1 Tax=Desulfosporosinus sp. BG TaxID=1633135 RepID=UPI00083A8004|nr:DUF4179 domain-containing protein [Desulfosporosinus sp. BG]ODA42360.1 hypothetical protein DSBG_0747 [Desulfosporosinus sp. BG]
MFEPEEATDRGEKEKEKEKDVNELDVADELEVINELIQAKSRSMDMAIPKDLDDYIQNGFAKGLKVQKARQFRKWSTLVACLLLVVLITVVRVSPAVAAVLHQIPGLGYIVELINYDKGLQSAVENDLFQPLGVSDEQEGVVFTVDGIVMDKSSLVIFYTVENKRGQGLVDLSEAKLFDEMGEPLKEVSIVSYASSNADQDGDGKVHSQINVNFSDLTVIPNNLSVKVQLRKIIQDKYPQPSDTLSSTWKVIIPVDKNKFTDMKKVYEVNQSVVIEGQKVTFEKVTVYPTRMILNVSYAPANSKKIFAFDDLVLVDEKGQEWGRMNGVTGSRPDENHEILFFQSNYFTGPKKLFLRGKSIRALNKEELSVTLDLERERILKAPPNLVLDHIVKTPSGKVAELSFLLKTNPEYDKERGFNIFPFIFSDARGQSLDTGEHYMLSHSEKPGYDQTITVTFPNNISYQSPITFQLEDYPSRITGDINIRIK